MNPYDMYSLTKIATEQQRCAYREGRSISLPGAHPYLFPFPGFSPFQAPGRWATTHRSFPFPSQKPRPQPRAANEDPSRQQALFSRLHSPGHEASTGGAGVYVGGRKVVK